MDDIKENLEQNNLENDDNINSSKPRKEHDIEEIINILADDTSDINYIGSEDVEKIDSENINLENSVSEASETVGRGIFNIGKSDDGEKVASSKEEVIDSKQTEGSSQASDKDHTVETKENAIRIEKVEPVKKVAKVETRSKIHRGIKSIRIDKKVPHTDEAEKQSLLDNIDYVFRKQKKLIFLILISICIFIAFFTTFYITKSTTPVYKIFELEDYSLANSIVERHRSGAYRVLNEDLFDGGEIYFLKDVENRQQLSLIIKSKSGKVVVFDGGWGENAEKLTNLIKELGGTVNCWFITHCDPDHIGAIYEITGDENFYGIKIERIAYSFFKKELYSVLGMEEPWFYEAVIKRFLDASENKNVILLNDLNLDQVLNFDDISVRVISDTKHLYKMDNYFDNNTSCCYKISLNGKSIVVLGDIARDASDLVLRLNDKDVLKSDIVVMSHHGQDGANRDLYEAINPEICLWGTPDWLYENKKGQWSTNETIKWMKDMQIEKHCISKDGDWILR